MSRSRSPGRQAASADCSAAAASWPRSARSARSATDSASRSATRSALASPPNAGCPSAPSRAAGWPANRSAAWTKASASCQGTIISSANPCAAGPYSSRIRSASTLVVISAALPSGVNTAQTRSVAAVRSTGGATPPQAHATAAGPVSTSPAGAGSASPASQARMRSAADCARSALRPAWSRAVSSRTIWSRTVRSPGSARFRSDFGAAVCPGRCSAVPNDVV